MKIKLFDSFAGIGALHKALKNIGIDVELVGMSEIDIEAIRAYNAIHYNKSWEEIPIPSKEEMIQFLTERNIGYDFSEKRCKIPRGNKLIEVYRISKALNNYGDISLINSKELPDFDLFNFSFPCTDISLSGLQKGMVDEDGNLTRSGLYIYGIEIIKNKKPKYIMIENVKNLVSKKFKPHFDDMLKELDNIGYNTYWKILNAKDYGIPQNRERVFVICIRKDIDTKKYNFPEPFDNGIRLRHLLDETVDKKYFINNEKIKLLLTQIKNDNFNEIIDHKNENIEIRPCINPDKIKVRQQGRRFKENDEPSFTLTTQDRHGILITENKLKFIGGVSEKQGYRVYDINGIACTQTTNGGGIGGKTGLYLINHKIRKLTPEECYRLMGFTNEDIEKVKKIGMSDSQMYKQAGNSIVVNVLEEIFKNLF